MEHQARLKVRIASLGELGDLVRAMRAMAASRVQEAQAALPGVRRYAAVIEDGIRKAAALLAHTGGGPTGAAAGAGPGIIVVACSEHGFAGAFNDHLLDRAALLIAGARSGCTLGIVGRRGAARAAERGLAPAWVVPMATHIGGILPTARGVARQLAGAATVTAVFGRYERGGRFEVEARGILPLPPALLARDGLDDRPLHHLDPATLLDRFAAEYLLAEIARALTESLASENGARLTVMEAADRNIGDKLEGLRRRASAARQEAVTS
ncbi:MAG: F0F1 ATP synthase subunit gamma, partial [Rhodospirillaceae bacterium]|nr:F0F1 ATP synthase subunit gamma [Rhodospirillaceae bacterium]